MGTGIRVHVLVLGRATSNAKLPDVHRQENSPEQKEQLLLHIFSFRSLTVALLLSKLQSTCESRYKGMITEVDWSLLLKRFLEKLVVTGLD